MAKLRNITDRELLVAVTGGVVGPDELLEIPDETYKAYVWPETIWAEVEGPDDVKPAKKTASSKTKGGE